MSDLEDNEYTWEEPTDAQPAMPAEVRAGIGFALEWTINDRRAIRMHSTAEDCDAIMSNLQAAVAWIRAQSQPVQKEGE